MNEHRGKKGRDFSKKGRDFSKNEETFPKSEETFSKREETFPKRKRLFQKRRGFSKNGRDFSTFLQWCPVSADLRHLRQPYRGQEVHGGPCTDPDVAPVSGCDPQCHSTSAPSEER